jgi:CheY-like chemotaxis protein
MLVDDDPINNLIIEKIGSSFTQVKMHTFEQGLKAFDTYSKKPSDYQLILLDINMLDISGWDFLDKCAKSGLTKVPVYILTSSIDPRDSEKAQSYPQIAGFLYKPFSRETLQEILGL